MAPWQNYDSTSKADNAPKQSYSLGQMTGRRTGAYGEITKMDFVRAKGGTVFFDWKSRKRPLCVPNPVCLPLISKQLSVAPNSSPMVYSVLQTEIAWLKWNGKGG